MLDYTHRVLIERSFAARPWLTICRMRRLAPEELEEGYSHGSTLQHWGKTLTPPVLPTGVRAFTCTNETGEEN